MDILGIRMSFDQIVDTVGGVVSRMHRILLEEDIDKSSGYFTIAGAENNRPLLVVSIGSIPKRKTEEYLFFSIENSQRLAEMRDLNNHCSSWQSRDEESKYWGGAVSLNQSFIFSFSGLLELADEAVMLGAAWRLGLISREYAEKVAGISDNQYFRKLYESYSE